MSNRKKSKKDKFSKSPMVSILTPTYNRRAFIPKIMECVRNQDYPKEKIEWVIMDDGEDKIKDLVENKELTEGLPKIRYYELPEKTCIGTKRNLINAKATGDILVYMDDDDYYPAERVSHAVKMLQKHPNCPIAGSSLLNLYINNRLLEFGPYAPFHATAGTFAFRRSLLKKTSFPDKEFAEEKIFLKDYTIPLVQLDTFKTILVIAHDKNTYDKNKIIHTAKKEHGENILNVYFSGKHKQLKDYYLNRTPNNP